jgi:hypothetical protein
LPADNLSSHPIEEAACSKSLLAWEVVSVADQQQSVEFPMLPVNGIIVILVTFALQSMTLGCIGAWSPRSLPLAPFGLAQSLLHPHQRTRGARQGARTKSNGGREPLKEEGGQLKRGWADQKEDGAAASNKSVNDWRAVENRVGSG